MARRTSGSGGVMVGLACRPLAQTGQYKDGADLIDRGLRRVVEPGEGGVFAGPEFTPNVHGQGHARLGRLDDAGERNLLLSRIEDLDLDARPLLKRRDASTESNAAAVGQRFHNELAERDLVRWEGSLLRLEELDVQ